MEGDLFHRSGVRGNRHSPVIVAFVVPVPHNLSFGIHGVGNEAVAVFAEVLRVLFRPRHVDGLSCPREGISCESRFEDDLDFFSESLLMFFCHLGTPL